MLILKSHLIVHDSLAKLVAFCIVVSVCCLAAFIKIIISCLCSREKLMILLACCLVGYNVIVLHSVCFYIWRRIINLPLRNGMG